MLIRLGICNIVVAGTVLQYSCCRAGTGTFHHHGHLLILGIGSMPFCRRYGPTIGLVRVHSFILAGSRFDDLAGRPRRPCKLWDSSLHVNDSFQIVSTVKTPNPLGLTGIYGCRWHPSRRQPHGLTYLRTYSAGSLIHEWQHILIFRHFLLFSSSWKPRRGHSHPG